MQANGQEKSGAARLIAALTLILGLAAASFVYSRDMAAYGYRGYLIVCLVSSALALGAAALYRSGVSKRRFGLALTVLVLGALALRLGALGAPAFLSDDIHRYVWDGRLSLAGHNPYESVPSQVLMDAPELAELYEPLNSKDFTTVYTPLAQAAFAAGVGLARVLGLDEGRGIRLIFLLADLATVILLTRLLRRRGADPGLAALYAWNPLVYWEVCGAGHTEALALPFVVLMIDAAFQGKGWKVGLALGLGALAKLTVLVMAPVLGWHLVRRRSWPSGLTAAALTIAVLVAGFAPVWFPGFAERLGSSLKLYNGHFAFNAPIYYSLSWLFGAEVGAAPPLPWIGAALGLLCLASVIAISALQNGRDERLCGALTAAAGAYLLCSSVFHPWYLLIPLVCALLARSASVIVLGLLLPISYLAYDAANGQTSAALMALQFAPFGLLFGREAIKVGVHGALRFRARTKFRIFARALEPGETVLDLGAGEGYVATYIEENGHPVMLVDVDDRNQTDLPYEVYDGRVLPFEDDSFDVGVLAYVLHHARDPDQVLDEAGRVCRRLVIIESVYESQRELELLTFLDQNVNLLRGLPKEELFFRRVDEWVRVFRQRGFSLEEGRWIGRGLHKQYLFRLSCEAATLDAARSPGAFRAPRREGEA